MLQKIVSQSDANGNIAETDCCGEVVGNRPSSMRHQGKTQRIDWETWAFRPSASQNQPFIPHPPCDPLAVQVLQQGDGVLPAGSGEVFEPGHVEPGGE